MEYVCTTTTVSRITSHNKVLLLTDLAHANYMFVVGNPQVKENQVTDLVSMLIDMVG